MITPPSDAPPILNPALPPARTLRKLFLTLYLRGRSSRGLRLKGAPRSIGKKFSLTLLVYSLFGLFAFYFIRQPVFALAVYLHGMTFVFLGMFISASAGEMLFNKEEAEILLHRPVTPRELLWSKIRVLIEVSLWLGGALNLAGLFVGLKAADGTVWFPIAHSISTVLEALFCTSCIVLVYQLCLKWFGRERLDTLMTTTQVLVAIVAVGIGQIMPNLVLRINGSGLLRFGPGRRWIALFPPSWFAGLDDALAGRDAATGSWWLAGFAVVATALVLWLAFGKLADVYEAGLRSAGDIVSRPKPRSGGRRWAETFVDTPPFKWFFSHPVTRSSFLLCAAYLTRDRDVKLRVFPGLAPMLIIPIAFLFRTQADAKNFGLAFSGGFLANMPFIALDLLQYSQQWQASDIFRVAPMQGPARVCAGARRAVFFLLTLPALIIVGLMIWAVQRDASKLLLFLPGILLMPVMALAPTLLKRGVPLSLPNEEARSAKRSLKIFGVMLMAMLLSGITSWAFSAGWFYWLLAGEAAVMVPIYCGLGWLAARQRWQPLD